VIEQNVSTIKAEVLSKASREEFQSIQLVLPNLITRQDYENIMESMKDKINKGEMNQTKSQIAVVKESIQN